jgi:hypothetical protein
MLLVIFWYFFKIKYFIVHLFYKILSSSVHRKYAEYLNVKHNNIYSHYANNMGFSPYIYLHSSIALPRHVWIVCELYYFEVFFQSIRMTKQNIQRNT